MKKIIPILFMVMFWISCSKKTPPPAVQDKNKTDSIVQNKIDTNKVRLVVRFGSTGPGADFPYITAFEDSIGTFSLYFNKKAIDYKKDIWGPEGETDFCLTLNELTEAEQKEFIDRTKAILEKAKWARIYENYPCPNLSRHRK